MLGIGAWSTRRKAAAAALLALLLAVPMGISERAEQPVVTGHSTFFNGNGFDPCLASIAGILRTQVMWFNDQILAERYGGKGTFIYVTENGSVDPRDRASLWTEGVFYDFVDPNGVHWHVDEAFMLKDTAVTEGLGGDPGSGDPGEIDPYYRVGSDRTYVWIVELSAFPIHDQFADDLHPDDPNYHDLYNFLALVDTCKFHRNAATNLDASENRRPDGSYDYNVTHDEDVLDPAHGHAAGTEKHTHESFMADLWVGTRPTLVPLGADASGAQWESDWATAGAQGEAANKYPGKPTSGVP